MYKHINFNFYVKIILALLILFIIFSSIPFSSHIPYFWLDYNFAEHAHNQNLKKKFLEVLPNSQNINGITVWILEPTLNFLSQLNYNISNRYDYYKYLSIFRILEILILFSFALSLMKKLKINDILIILFLVLFLYRANFFFHKYIVLTSQKNDEIVNMKSETNLWFKNSDDFFLNEKLYKKKIDHAIKEIKNKFNEKKIFKKESFYRINTLKIINTKKFNNV